MAKNRDQNRRLHAPVRSSKGGASITPGDHPRNTGGKKGRSGRKPLPVGLFCVAVLADPAVRKGILATARNPKAPAHAAIIKLVLAYSEGLPTATHRIEGPHADTVYYFPDNGRGLIPDLRGVAPKIAPSPRTVERTVAPAEPNGHDGRPGFLWPDGTRRVIPPPE